MRYKKIADCPGELNEVIKLVNSLPKDIDFIYSELKKEFDSKKKALLDAPQTGKTSFDLIKLPSEYEKKIKQLLPESVYLYTIGIFDTEFDTFSFYQGTFAQLEPLEKLLELIQLRNLLTATAALKPRDFEVGASGRLTFQPIINFGLSKEGYFKPFSSPIVEIFQRNDIQLERLRLCPICKKIFWAKRTDAPTCLDKKCSNNFHQKKKRIKEYEAEYNRELKALEKLQLTLPPENSLIAERKEKTEKLLQKINEEKAKNGNL